MKSFLIIIFLSVSVFTFGQTDNKGKTEIYAGYGVVTAQDVISGLSNMLAGALIPGMLRRIDIKGGGAYFVGIDYYPGNRGTIGLQINYASYDQKYELTDHSTTAMSTKYFTPMVRGKYNWINKEFFQFYSAVAGGATFITGKNTGGDKENHTTLSFQVSPFGIRAGNSVAVFLEAGFGFQGLLSGGISFRF